MLVKTIIELDLLTTAPTYCGMIVAIFHGSEKGWKVMPRPFVKARSLS